MGRRTFTLNCEFCLCTMFILSWTLNATTILLVGRKGRLEVLRQADYLISYVSITAIVASTIGLVTLFGNGVTLGDDFACASATFLAMVVINAFPAGVLYLNSERMRGYLCKDKGPGSVPIWLLGAWGFAILTALPEFFTTEYNPDTFFCYKTGPLDPEWIGMLYGVVRCYIHHVGPCILLTNDVYTLRDKWHLVYKENAGDIEARLLVPRVRFVCVNSGTFIAMWLPFGVILTIFEHGDFPQPTFVLGFLLSGYLVALPLTIFWTTKDLTRRIIFRRRRPKQHGPYQEITIVRRDRNIPFRWRYRDVLASEESSPKEIKERQLADRI